MTRTDRRDGMDSVVVLPTTAWRPVAGSRLDLSEAGGTAQLRCDRDPSLCLTEYIRVFKSQC